MIKKGFFRLQTIQGETLKVGKTSVTPLSRRLSLGLPGWVTANKGFVLICQHPNSVKIEKDGRLYEVPIRDYQKIIILTLLLIIAVCAFVTHRIGHKENNQ